MDKREFVQRFVIENYEIAGPTNEKIANAEAIFNKIEQFLTKPVSTTNLWDYNDK
jgi:hypothetical protein